MKERPILFSAPMVRAILRDVDPKTQTRRVMKPQPVSESASGACWIEINGRHQWAWHEGEDQNILPNEKQFTCPYGQPGDRLWGRETWQRAGGDTGFWYAATDLHADDGNSPVSIWRPSIHMPRAVSRITLEVTRVRVERLQDISEADAIAEGIERSYDHWRDYRTDPAVNYPSALAAVESYRTLWESINGPDAWESNPWVWVIEFRRLEGGAA